MESLTRLWPSLESSPALLEVTEEWQRRLAGEYAPLRRFLVATDTIAGGYPGRHGCRRYRVVADDPSDICGIDDDSGEQIELTLADVTCYRFNVRALAGEICAALGFRPAFGPVPDLVRTWRLGTLPMQLGGCPVYLSLRAAPEDLCAAVLAIAAEARRPFLLLTGSRHSEGGPLAAVLQLTGGHVAPAAELVGLGAGGRLVAAPDSLRSLAMLLGVAVADASPACVFRLEGEYRTIAFDGATIHLKESAGLWYIGRLLASPNRDLPAPLRWPPKTGPPHWAKVSVTMYRNDGGIVDAELLRPSWWITHHGIQAGQHLPMHIEELQVQGAALVTTVEDCPEIAPGEGSVVTARFCTREVHSIARVEILGPDGQIETLEGTTIHPIWSEDRQDWVPLGELQQGETLRAASGPAMVLSVTILSTSVPVYNIEVHGEHVYQVGWFAMLVHNANECFRVMDKIETAAAELGKWSDNVNDLDWAGYKWVWGSYDEAASWLRFL